MTAIPLGPGGEFDRIRAIAAALGDVGGELGDDTGVIASAPGTHVISTDVSVEHVHFRQAWLTFEEIGWRAAASALSDLAAAAAEPLGLVSAVTVPSGRPEEELIAVMRGVGGAARTVGCAVLGGDLSTGPSWSIAITVIGSASKRMSRRGATPGETLWCTGALGGARAALTSWRSGRDPEPSARAAFAHPVPRIAAGGWLAAHGATAMLDLSDGLAGDAWHLAAASEVGLEVNLDRMPVHPAVPAVALEIGEPAAAFAAVGGEDYELLVTLPHGFTGADAFRTSTGLSLTEIGRVVAQGGVRMTLAGAPIALRGFRHSL